MRRLRKLSNIIETEIKGRRKLKKTDTAELRKKPEKTTPKPLEN